MERDFLASGTTLFRLRTPVYTATVSELEQEEWQILCFPLEGELEMSEVSAFFFSILSRAMQPERIELEYAEFSQVFFSSLLLTKNFLII